MGEVLAVHEDQCSDPQHSSISWRLWLMPATRVLVYLGQEDPGVFMVIQFSYN